MFKADVSVQSEQFLQRRETRLIPDTVFKALCESVGQLTGKIRHRRCCVNT